MTEKSRWSWVDVWQSVNQISVVFGVGITFGIVGPSLIDLAELYSSTPDKIAMMFSARAFGLFLGSCSGSFFYKHLNDQILMMISLIVYGAVHFLIPFLPNIVYLYGLSSAAGIALGISHVGSQVRLVRIWKNQSASALQAFHTAFGVGSMLAPFFCAPFLSLKEAGHIVKESKLYVPYTTIGLLFLLILVSMVAAYCVDPAGIGETKREASGSHDSKRNTFEIVMLILVFLHVILCQNTELAFSALISIYAVESPSLHFSKPEAAYLAGVFWSTLSGGRIISVFVLMVFSIRQLLVISHCLCISSSVILIVFNNSASCTWLGAALMGLGLSSMYGAGAGLLAQYFLVRHFHISVILTAVCLGMAVAAYIVPPIVEAEPKYLQYYMGLGNVVHLVVFIVIFIITTKKQTLRQKEQAPQEPPVGAD